MKNQLIKILSLALLTTTTFSCKKEYDNNNLAPLAPSYAEIPVTVTNANFFERFPVITAKGNFTAAVPPSTTPVPATPTAAAPGNFSITFSIPADKGTIKEITRVATGANGLLTVQTGTAASQLNFNNSTTAPGTTAIPGNGTNTITFNSSLLRYTEYRTRVGTTAGGAATTALATPQAPVQLLYAFVLTLSTPGGDIQVIPTQVRVRVIE
jgi:hypothetical protein